MFLFYLLSLFSFFHLIFFVVFTISLLFSLVLITVRVSFVLLPLLSITFLALLFPFLILAFLTVTNSSLLLLVPLVTIPTYCIEPSPSSCRFLRLTHIPEEDGLCKISSDHRHARAAQLSSPENREDLVTLLSDTQDSEHPFFRDSSAEEEIVKTVAVGQ